MFPLFSNFSLHFAKFFTDPESEERKIYKEGKKRTWDCLKFHHMFPTEGL